MGGFKRIVFWCRSFGSKVFTEGGVSEPCRSSISLVCLFSPSIVFLLSPLVYLILFLAWQKQIITVLSGATFIFVLIGVNMVGYAVGIEGTAEIVSKLISTDGLLALLYSYIILVVGVCIMNYIKLHRGQREDRTFAGSKVRIA